jgi:hypothetical protein
VIYQKIAGVLLFFLGLITAFTGAKLLGKVLQILSFLTIFYVVMRLGDYLFDFRDGSKVDIMGSALTAFIIGFLVSWFGYKIIKDYGVALIGLVGGAMLTLMIVTPLDLYIHYK